MTNEILLSPPVAFVIILSAICVLVWICSHYAYRKQGSSVGATKEYACGENFQGHSIQPDYSQFFPFAFFFTILHIVALVIATVPAETVETFTMAVTYIVGAAIGLVILLRTWK
jgi:NADH:ubiquinone oxidoreductase subunit 3 (subunit A)